MWNHCPALSKLEFRIQPDYSPRKPYASNRNYSSAKMQLANHWFCVSWGSDQIFSSAQKNISPKPEAQLTQNSYNKLQTY